MVDWVNVYHEWLGRKSDLLFPGEDFSEPLEYGSAREQIKRLFAANGMTDTKGEHYTIHSFRTFARSFRLEAGYGEAPRNLRRYTKMFAGTKSTLMIQDISCTIYFDGSRLPRIDGSQVVNRQSNKRVAVLHIMTLQGPMENVLAVASYPGVCSIEFKPYRHDIRLIFA